jgi:hypothetical protein
MIRTNLLPLARSPDGQILSHPLLLQGAQGTALSHFVFNLGVGESWPNDSNCDTNLRHSIHAPLAKASGLEVEAALDMWQK